MIETAYTKVLSTSGRTHCTSFRLELSGNRVINQIMNSSLEPYWHATSWTGHTSRLVGEGQTCVSADYIW